MYGDGVAAPDDQNDGWLTLHMASALLGVPPARVRRWADAGRIPVRRTTGGHRRFDPAAVQTLMLARDEPRTAEPTLPTAIGRPVAGSPSWYTHLSQSPVAEQMRGLGQRLLGLLIQYLAWRGEDSRFLADARAVGVSYGAAACTAGVSLSETVQAFLHFRSSFWRMALGIPPVAQVTDAREVLRITERIEHFMDGVLLGTIAGYEGAAPAAGPPPA